MAPQPSDRERSPLAARFSGTAAPDLDGPRYLAALARVRELSEHATLRPSPYALRCIPFAEPVLQHVSALKQRLDRKVQISILLAELSSSFPSSSSVPTPGRGSAF